MNAIPHLQRLTRQCGGDPETALEHVLGLLCEQLGMSLAVLGVVEDDVHTVHLAVTSEGGRVGALEGSWPASQSWCAHVPADGPLVVRDVADHPELGRLEATTVLDIQCYVGTVVRGRGGQEIARVGVVGHAPHDGFDERDLAVLEGLAAVAGDHVEARQASACVVPVPSVPSRTGVVADLGGVAAAVSRAEDLEGLTRPLLEALHELSGIASTYLTVVHDVGDDGGGMQELLFARNTKPGFALPEGLQVPWGDTLCKRALDSGRSCTTDVPAVWGDSEAAAALGIVTYLSVPVRLADGRLWGTLCGADDVAHEQAEAQLPTLNLFARLIAGEVERADALARERARATHARREADTDELTGCASRRTVQPWLVRQFDALESDQLIALAFVDIDRFKDVNDRLGHATGDELLATLGARLRGAARDGDLVARIGGDEFVVAARLPHQAVAPFVSRVRGAGRFVLPTAEGELEVGCSTGLATSQDAGGPADLLSLADAEMYRHKASARV